jgi:hypothetical protein
LVLGELFVLVLMPVHALVLNRFPMNPRLHGVIIPKFALKQRNILNVVRPSAPVTSSFPISWVEILQSVGDHFLFIIEQLMFTLNRSQQNPRQFSL